MKGVEEFDVKKKDQICGEMARKVKFEVSFLFFILVS